LCSPGKLPPTVELTSTAARYSSSLLLPGQPGTVQPPTPSVHTKKGRKCCASANTKERTRNPKAGLKGLPPATKPGYRSRCTRRQVIRKTRFHLDVGLPPLSFLLGPRRMLHTKRHRRWICRIRAAGLSGFSLPSPAEPAQLSMGYLLSCMFHPDAAPFPRHFTFYPLGKGCIKRYTMALLKTRLKGKRKMFCFNIWTSRTTSNIG
jgi:hypothetical protein